MTTVCRLCEGPTTTALSHGKPYQVCVCCGSETLAADRWCRHKQLELPLETGEGLQGL